MASSIPIGYKFCPTEQELIIGFLYLKITGKPLPRNGIINNCDLYGNKEPWEIWEDFGESDDHHLYSFAPLFSIMNPNIGSGTWRVVSSGIKIYVNYGEKSTPIGMMQIFYYENREMPLHHRRWVMYEYSVDSSLLPPGSLHDNSAVCRIERI